MKKINKIFYVLMFSLIVLCLAACGEKTPTKTPVEKPNKAEEALKLLIVDQAGYVDADFQLPGTIKYEGAEHDLTWTSDNGALVISEVQIIENTDNTQTKYYKVTVNRPTSGEGEKITITAKVVIGTEEATKKFEYSVYPIDIYEVADNFRFDKANKVVTEAFDLETTTSYGGVDATIAWSVHEDYKDLYTINNNKVEFSVEEEVTVKITATFTVGTTSTKKDYIVTLKPNAGAQPTIVEPVAGKSFVFGCKQESLGQYLYFTGKTANKDYYMETTEDGSQAVKVTANAVEGGYTLSFVNAEGQTKYLDIVANGTFVNLYIVDAATGAFKYNEEHKTFTKDVDGTEYYIGTYNTYNTLSASKMSYIETSFPCHFYELPSKYEMVTAPVAGQSYKFGSEQESLGQLLFFAGTTANKDYYMATTEDGAASTEVTLEAATGGFYISFKDATGAKKYLDVKVSGTYINAQIAENPNVVWVWDETYNTLVTTVDVEGTATQVYLGTYNTYNTLSASKYSYIETSYPCHLYTGGPAASTPEVKPEPTPEPTPTPKPETEPATVNKTVADLATNVPTTSMDVIYIIEGIWKTKDGVVPANNTYGNGDLLDKDGNSLVIYGLSSAKDACLTFAEGVYTYSNAKDFLTLNVEDGSIVKIGAVYNANFKNYSAYLIEITGKAELEEEVIPTASNVTKVTSLDQLTDGAKIVVAYKTFLMGAFDGSGKTPLFTSVELTQVEVTDAVEVITLVKSGDNWLLQLENGKYVSYSGSGNSATESETADAAAQWTITITDGIISIANVSLPERLFQYNSGSPRFVCYKGTQINPTLYVVTE